MALWQGRFSQKMDDEAWHFNASLAFDRRLALQDIRGSQAWARALASAGVLEQPELGALMTGLETVAEEFKSGRFQFQAHDEDIHTAVERRLGELIGPVAGKLHTGRSRNDQVATDFRLWLIDHLPQLASGLTSLQETLIARAERDLEVLMPGYTHLQRAQPVLLSHWWLSHFWPLERDKRRLSEVQAQLRVLPLGAGALAGTPIQVDRKALAEALGFELAAPNSIDAVSDRDFAADFLYFSAMCGVHLSRLAEQLIIFSSQEFGFFSFSDRHATGSSLMPQKKNPDLMELVRGIAADLIGRLTGGLALLKALPSAYDKDLQRDKPGVFFAFDTLLESLKIVTGVVAELEVQADKMMAAISEDMMATDLADQLVAGGMPFREAHQLIAGIIDRVGKENAPFRELLADQLQGGAASGQPSVADILAPRRSVDRRSAIGGTALSAVETQIGHARSHLKTTRAEPFYRMEGENR